MTATTIIDSPVGPLVLTASARGLTGLAFASGRVKRAAQEDAEGQRPDPAAEVIIERATRQLEEYFQGTRTQFELPLELDGSDFQGRVWRAIAAIPYGETASYAAIAAAAGNPGAYRAAGTACGANPVAIVIPCHRVVGSDRGLHGFGGGLDVKRWLLAHEAGPQAKEAVSRRQPVLV